MLHKGSIASESAGELLRPGHETEDSCGACHAELWRNSWRRPRVSPCCAGYGHRLHDWKEPGNFSLITEMLFLRINNIVEFFHSTKPAIFWNELGKWRWVSMTAKTSRKPTCCSRSFILTRFDQVDISDKSMYGRHYVVILVYVCVCVGKEWSRAGALQEDSRAE